MLFYHEVISNTKLNSRFVLIKLRAKDSLFIFNSGQFTTIKVKDAVFRCYSFASLPDDLPYWEIFVDITPGGPGTTYLKSLLPGQVVASLGARGNMVLSKKQKISIFAATGCGIAPFVPMIKELIKNPEHNIYLLWGLRKKTDMVLHKLFSLCSENNRNFNFDIFLSNPDKTWKGKVGHITSALESINDLYRGANYYLSGSGDFVKEAKGVLLKNKVLEKKIQHEACY